MATSARILTKVTLDGTPVVSGAPNNMPGALAYLKHSALPTAVDSSRKRLFLNTDQQRVEIFGLDAAPSPSARQHSLDLQAALGDGYRYDEIKGVQFFQDVRNPNKPGFLLVAHSGYESFASLGSAGHGWYRNAKLSLFVFESFHVRLERSPPLPTLREPLPVVRSGLTIPKNSLTSTGQTSRELAQTSMQVGDRRSYQSGKWRTNREFLPGQTPFDFSKFEAAFRDVKTAFAIRHDHYRTKKYDLVFVANEKSIFQLDLFDVTVRVGPTATHLTDLLTTDVLPEFYNKTALALGFRLVSLVPVQNSMPSSGVWHTGEAPANATVAAHHSYLIATAVCKDDVDVLAPSPNATDLTCNGRSRLYLLDIDAMINRQPSMILCKTTLPVRALHVDAREGGTSRSGIKDAGDDPFLLVVWTESRDGKGPIRIFPSGFQAVTEQLHISFKLNTCMRVSLQGVQVVCKEYASALCNCLVKIAR